MLQAGLKSRLYENYFLVAVKVPVTMPPISSLPFMVFFSTVPSYVTGACWPWTSSVNVK